MTHASNDVEKNYAYDLLELALSHIINLYANGFTPTGLESHARRLSEDPVFQIENSLREISNLERETTELDHFEGHDIDPLFANLTNEEIS